VLTELLTFGVADGSANRELTRLRGNEVTGVEMLQTVLAVWLLSSFNERKLPSDDRLTYHLAIQVYKLRPGAISISRRGYKKWRAANGKSRQVVGEAIRSRLGLFFARVVEALNDEQHRRQANYKALSQPFPKSSTVH
jgi:hypothetical protein